MTKHEYFSVLSGECYLEYHGYICEVYSTSDLKVHFADTTNGEHIVTLSHYDLATRKDVFCVRKSEVSHSANDLKNTTLTSRWNSGVVSESYNCKSLKEAIRKAVTLCKNDDIRSVAIANSYGDCIVRKSSHNGKITYRWKDDYGFHTRFFSD